MKSDNLVRGEYINISFDLFKPRNLLDNVEELTSLLLLYQRIGLYKNTSSFVDEVKDLIPLAITETILDFDTIEKKISFIFSLLKYYQIEVARGNKNDIQKKVVTVGTKEALESLTNNELMEALVTTVNYRKGSGEKNYILEGMMKGIRHNYGTIEDIIREYIKINPASFEEFILKIGFSKTNNQNIGE